MARRIRFDIALATTILGFWTAGVIHVVSVGIASHRLRAYHVQTEALSQAYYYAIFAAALYQVVSYLLCLTAWGAYSNHYQKQFRLTMAQRTLMVQTMAFLVYEWLGALVYATIEGWRFLDALYWSNLTILTVGLGDLYVPTTTLGRALLFPYALIGVIFVGLVIGSIRSLVLDKARVRTSARVAEKLRLNQITGVSRGKATKHSLPDELLQTNREESAFLPNRAELLRQMAEFNTMRTIQKSAQRRRESIDLSISVAAVAILWTIGAVVFWITERKQKWNYFESLYFCYTTLMTIGYGDYRPESNSGKPFFVFWSLLAVPSLTILISNLGETAVRWLKDLTIWVGEITLHPSKRGSLGRGLLRNMRRIICRVIGGSKRRGDPETGTLRHQLQNLGQVHTEVANLSDLVSRPRHMCGIAYGSPANEQGVSAEIRESSKREAEEDCEQSVEREHEYIRMLRSQIKRAYSDLAISAEQRKQYSFADWVFFLQLLGEEETRSGFIPQASWDLGDHGGEERGPKAGTLRKPAGRRGSNRSSQNSPGNQGRKGENKTEKWSWLGERSPLRAPQSESQWVLEMLFKRLEQRLEDHWKNEKSYIVARRKNL
ncbi:hypothetical protein LTR10_023713 [Elasticomyces elasticus]|uniref:Potassium channel domain-containing protein n=1 Tax=Exophiala sideris TaxID=1016849 RepID=A0ABR0IUE2_9EURO|nr:hypothetical protein LTR10_023713 [Elasticomyces elasticus]KAK5020950.1 hypothetical protein LTS07_011331 [Exophiala sideris]KAK5023114.1 hypothetical protein LTR13_011320 [Exophiala sideris]KAK5048442.1 hypothetical protein LTR69_011356 [Exophiala sideris]KAK5176096.1 hypothetical protein LTR44_011341 [Eurotiomycetes sp. CCFEE 6388]